MDSPVWEPPALLERLTVGARVRVRISPECRVASAHGRHDGPWQGTEAVIEHIHHDPFVSGHRFVLIPRRGARIVCAAIELTPLEEARNG